MVRHKELKKTLLPESEVQEFKSFPEGHTKPIREKSFQAKSIQNRIKLLESSPEYLNQGQIKDLRKETEEKVKKAQEIKSSLEELHEDPDFLEEDDMKKLGQALKRVKKLI